jgi:8-oxo-dGTP diphosphatase
MIKYVAGFIFSPERDRVLLIRKNRPDFQAGKLNGIGGKVEQDETYLQAMMRETYEESGLIIHEWTNFAILNHQNYCIHFYMSISDYYCDFFNKTDEKIEIHIVNQLSIRNDLMNHIRWLVPLSLNTDIKFPIEYTDIGVN